MIVFLTFYYLKTRFLESHSRIQTGLYKIEQTRPFKLQFSGANFSTNTSNKKLIEKIVSSLRIKRKGKGDF